ncbi:MAG: hypothetical protein HY040_14215 [Planctomycetes bacterium]|nr:hypothetical protein [Planctomycetota bacterium]
MSMYAQLPILVLVISLVYSATRYDDWGSIFIEAFRWGSRMVVFLVGIGAVLWLLSYLMANPATAP